MNAKVIKRSLGITFNTSSKTEILVWAPYANEVAILLDDNSIIPLKKQELGYWKEITDKIKPGDLYKIKLDNEKGLPDPASLSQPNGVHGQSQAVDLKSFKWNDNAHENIPLEEYIIYEIHTGTFTPEGTF